jgi:4-aminobutyrate aminotransferase-like enzyme
MLLDKTLRLLQDYESPNVTFIAADGSWPIVWERARGVTVWDSRGRRYVDLTAAFGVAAAGHGHPAVVRSARQQMGKLLHAMGDVHPHRLKAELARELSRLTFERWARHAPASLKRISAERKGTRCSVPCWGKTIFCNSGFEAVEAALKTAMLARRKPGVIAFEGAYHGLGYGALNATHRDHFRASFRPQLAEFAAFAPYPEAEADLPTVAQAVRRLLRRGTIGAILVEPIQGRGGIRIPPRGFLPMLRRLCDESGAALVLDEVYTGLGRTGKWFACEHSEVVPDLVCLGKALTGGFPLSACVGRHDLMDAAWPKSTGEAIHTSTFLGHPVGCAMALAQVAVIRRQRLVQHSAEMGRVLMAALEQLVPPPGVVLRARGCGLMAGLELRWADGCPATSLALAIVQRMLARGLILLPEGEAANVIGFTPPLTVTAGQLRRAVRVLGQVLRE